MYLLVDVPSDKVCNNNDDEKFKSNLKHFYLYAVPFPVLPPFILLKFGTLSPFTTFSSG